MPEVSIHADLSAFGKFVKTMDKADATRIRAQMRKAVTAAGKDMLQDAKANAAWSRTIPGATTLKTSFAARSAGVKMRTDPKRAPMAYYFERGSRNSGGRYIKHPVYGSQSDSARVDVRDRYDNKRTWRAIPTRPYFFKAGAKGRDEFAKKLREDINALAHELGFRG